MSSDEQQGFKNSSFPERFADILFERYPDWKQYVIPADLKWQSEQDFSVEVPSRFAPYCPLMIDTMDDGIIISWVGWHVHCDSWGDTYTEEQFVAKALDYIDGLLSTGLAIIVTWTGESVGSGGTCPVEDIDEQLETGFWSIASTKGLEIIVISWNGEYDRGEFDPAKLCQS